jgi:hypothetical protein
MLLLIWPPKNRICATRVLGGHVICTVLVMGGGNLQCTLYKTAGYSGGQVEMAMGERKTWLVMFHERDAAKVEAFPLSFLFGKRGFHGANAMFGCPPIRILNANTGTNIPVSGVFYAQELLVADFTPFSFCSRVNAREMECIHV